MEGNTLPEVPATTTAFSLPTITLNPDANDGDDDGVDEDDDSSFHPYITRMLCPIIIPQNIHNLQISSYF